MHALYFTDTIKTLYSWHEKVNTQTEVGGEGHFINRVGCPSIPLAVFKITTIYYIHYILYIFICTKCWQFYINTTRIADCRDRASFLKHGTFLDSSLSEHNPNSPRGAPSPPQGNQACPCSQSVLNSIASHLQGLLSLYFLFIRSWFWDRVSPSWYLRLA